jgi:hypothetical protein
LVFYKGPLSNYFITPNFAIIVLPAICFVFIPLPFSDIVLVLKSQLPHKLRRHGLNFQKLFTNPPFWGTNAVWGGEMAVLYPIQILFGPTDA